jgi:hypothetical protein
MLKHFGGSLVFAIVCFALAAWYGWSQTGSMQGLATALWIVAVLTVLEVSLSFDNAVVNATVLKDMDEIWQKRFLTWGMAIAVFGMRVAFPLAIVAIAAGIGPFDAVELSLRNPREYERIVSSAHVGIAGFGGAFLCLVGSKFFFDSEKRIHWITAVEAQLARFSHIPSVEIALLLLTMFAISLLLPDGEALTFLVAGMMGIVTFVVVEGFSRFLELREEAARARGITVAAGLGGFLYLNVLDASFSFDGVIGAFALSNNMVIIALGLSVGAMFVRSLTIMLVHKGTLAEYRYLEHGAFWAILALGVIMLLSSHYAIPETVTGLIGAVLIGVSFAWSVLFNRREALSSD